MGAYTRGQRLRLSLTLAGTQLGFISKEQGGSTGLQTETGQLKSNEHQQEGGWTSGLGWILAELRSLLT